MLPRARMADGEEGGMGSVGRLARTARSVITFCLGISYMANVLLGSPLIDDLNLVLMAGVIVLRHQPGRQGRSELCCSP